MDIPQDFLDNLDIEFQSRLRARYSRKLNSIVIEQRVGRNMIGSVPREKLLNEQRQSLAEGYRPVMYVATSEKIRCPKCDRWLDVPNRTTREIRCLACKIRGRDSRLFVGYYPLNNILIEHLKSIDPLRNMDKNDVEDMQSYNEKIVENQQKQLADDAESYSSDNINQLMGILQTGYSGIKVKEGSEIKGITHESK